jgi:adenosylmethionine-8-amino-7-oxononanoate aminotransferase
MDEGHIFRRDMARPYPLLVRGAGAYVWDDAGHRYLDATAGISVSCTGHGRERVAEALRRQAMTLAYTTSGYFRNAPALQLPERISQLTPGDLNNLFFTTGGSQAVETAIKLARRYHLERGQAGKHLVIGRWASYHGATLGALSASGHVPRRRPYTPYLLPFPHVAPAYGYRCPFGCSLSPIAEVAITPPLCDGLLHVPLVQGTSREHQRRCGQCEEPRLR